MSAAWAEQETLAKRYGATIAEVSAAENEQLLANRDALQSLILERRAATEELARNEKT